MTTQTSPLLNPYKGLMSNNQTGLSSPAVPNLNNASANMTPNTSNVVVPGSNQYNKSFVQSNASNIAPPTSNTPYTVKSGDTLSGIAGQNNMSLKDLLALNPQYQANPNLINPGENITIGGQSNNNITPVPNMSPDTSQNMTPIDPYTAFADRMSPDTSQLMSPNTQPTTTYPMTPLSGNNTQTPPTQNIQTTPATVNTPAVPYVSPESKTSDGQVINPATGGVSTLSAASSSGGSSPAVPSMSAMTSTPGYDSAVSDYKSNLELSPEELANQENINKLTESFRKAYTGEGDRAIPLEFITGRQASLEKRSLDLAQPLQAKAALLQAKRTAALEASKFGLEQEQKKIDDTKPIAGTSFYDPTTGKFITAPSETADEAFTLSSGQTRFDAAGNPIASNIGTGGIDATNDYKNWQLAGGQESTGMSFAEWQGKNVPGQQSEYLQRVGSQAIQSVDELLPQIAGNTTGWGAFFKKLLPESQARTFAAQLDTLKSNITFGSLVAMREASKTGGALGQVSDKEGQLLQSSLGALDQLQSASQLKAQLNKIKQSLQRWNTAVANDTGAGSDTGDGFNW